MSKISKILGAAAVTAAAAGIVGASIASAADLSNIPAAMITNHQMPTFVIGQDAKVADVLSAIDVAAVLANVKESTNANSAGTVTYSKASGVASNTKIETPNIGTSVSISDVDLSDGKVTYTYDDEDKEVGFRTYVEVGNTTTGYDEDNNGKASMAVNDFKYVIDFTKENADGINVNETSSATNKEINIFGGTYTLNELTDHSISFSPGLVKTVGEGDTLTICGTELKFQNICCDCYGGYGGVQVVNVATGETTTVAVGESGDYGSPVTIAGTHLKIKAKTPIEAAKTTDGKGSITVSISDKGARVSLENGLSYDQNLEKDNSNGNYIVNFDASGGYLKKIEITSSNSFGGDDYTNPDAIVEGNSITFPKNISKLTFTTNENTVKNTQVVVSANRDADINKARVHLKFVSSNNQDIDADLVVQNVTNVDGPVYVTDLIGNIYKVESVKKLSGGNYSYFLKYQKVTYSDARHDDGDTTLTFGHVTVDVNTSTGKINVTYDATTGTIAELKDNMGTIKLDSYDPDTNNVNITVTDSESTDTVVELNALNSTGGDDVTAVELDGNGVSKDKIARTNYGTKVKRDDDSATITLFKEHIRANIRLDATDASFDEDTCSLKAGSVGGCTYSGKYTAKTGDTIGECSSSTCNLIKIESVGGGATPTIVSSVDSVAKYDTEVSATNPTNNMVVVGGPAINRVTAALEGKTYPAYGAASGLAPGQYKIEMKTVGGYNVLIIQGYDATQTKAASQAVINAIKGITPLSGTEYSNQQTAGNQGSAQGGNQ